jgi:hypothetical protein
MLPEALDSVTDPLSERRSFCQICIVTRSMWREVEDQATVVAKTGGTQQIQGAASVTCKVVARPK